ncbi:hypothetical protein GR210_12435 [Rhizobium leguminosarum]|uniref:hypothetical protein n=1 Tax=Rhizobium leguminosarum TaxID=384 RepID=UPI0013DB79E9|nr:hypothetical protein [Rhizobium leguminosarum]NEH49590.1 hypothetical protein [Rhizobium leguminosarum]
MDRNIITVSDANMVNRITREADSEWRKTYNVPARTGKQGENEGPPLRNVKADETLARLVKFIPAEALSLYLALSGIAFSDGRSAQESLYWLVALLVIAALFNALYLSLLWKVKRISQIAISTLALFVYAIAANGPLVQALHVDPRFSTLALTILTAFLCFFEPPEDLRL